MENLWGLDSIASQHTIYYTSAEATIANVLSTINANDQAPSTQTVSPSLSLLLGSNDGWHGGGWGSRGSRPAQVAFLRCTACWFLVGLASLCRAAASLCAATASFLLDYAHLAISLIQERISIALHSRADMLRLQVHEMHLGTSTALHNWKSGLQARHLQK